MPDGVVQWFDPASGDAAIVHARRVYAARASDMESRARHAGARVHFDISHETTTARAVNVTFREGTRTSPRQHRFGDLTGARRPDTKGAAPFARPRQQLGRTLAAHPLQVARAWARCVQGGDLATALALYAPDAVVHTADGTVSGRTHLQAWLEAGGLVRAGTRPDVRGTAGDADTATVTWPAGVAADRGTVVRCRIEHGLVAEQWIDPAPPTVVETVGAAATPFQVSARGDVDADAVDYARRRVEAVIDHIREPVLSARLTLTHAADPARDRPALAQAALDVDGRMVRAHVAAADLREATHRLQRRLEDQLEQRASHRRALRRRTGRPEPGQWRHGDLPSDRPEYQDRPPEQRRLVRHKTVPLDELTPDEAAFDMDQLDHDFHLFRDLASGEDAVLERRPGHTWRLTRLRPAGVDPGPTAIPLVVSELPPVRSTVDNAIARLNIGGERFVFFADTVTGRGTVVYRRYDGHYGLVTAE